MRLKKASYLGVVVAVLLFGAALTASASAAPAWKFNGTELVGTEEMIGSAGNSTIAFPVFGLTTECDISYSMAIWNSAGTGQAKVGAIEFESCSTNSKFCSVEKIVPEKMPWTGLRKTISVTSYLILEGIRFTISYGGEECVLFETPVPVVGTIGPRFSQPAQTFTLDAASFAATGTKLTAFGTPVTWDAVFSTEAVGAHKGEPVS